MSDDRVFDRQAFYCNSYLWKHDIWQFGIFELFGLCKYTFQSKMAEPLGEKSKHSNSFLGNTKRLLDGGQSEASSRSLIGWHFLLGLVEEVSIKALAVRMQIWRTNFSFARGMENTVRVCNTNSQELKANCRTLNFEKEGLECTFSLQIMYANAIVGSTTLRDQRGT